jgi:hypothetical protein
MIVGMVPDAWVQQAAGKLIEQHGADAMTEVTRLSSLARSRGDADAFVLMFRVGLAVVSLQTDRATA